MRTTTVWRRLLGVEHAVIESVELEGEGEFEVLVARVRPSRSRRGRCGHCSAGAGDMTKAADGGGGDRWTSAR